MTKSIRRLQRKLIWKVGGIAAFVILRAVDLGLNVLGYRRLCSLLIKLSPHPDPNRVSLRRALKVAYLVEHAAVSPLAHTNCLRRSLTLWWFLRWFRLDSDIRIGINLNDGHAWVEHGGQIINDAPDTSSQYAVLYTNELSPEIVSRIS